MIFHEISLILNIKFTKRIQQFYLVEKKKGHRKVIQLNFNNYTLRREMLCQFKFKRNSQRKCSIPK